MGGTEIYARDAGARAPRRSATRSGCSRASPHAERPEYAVRDDVQGGVRRPLREQHVPRRAPLRGLLPQRSRHRTALPICSTTGGPTSRTCITSRASRRRSSRELAARGIPVVLTLHDYWLLCHRGQLLDLHLHRCEDPRTCYACLPAEAGVGRAGTLAARAMHRIERVVPRWRGKGDSTDGRAGCRRCRQREDRTRGSGPTRCAHGRHSR